MVGERLRRLSFTHKVVTGMFVLLLCILASCSVKPVPTIKPPVASIRVVMDNSYPPYSFVDEQGNLQGILVDQWKLWEKYTGVKVELTGLPWGDALGQMETGSFDVIDTIFYTEERSKIFDYTKPYAKINVRIFFRKSISGIKDAQNLKGFRVAVKASDANADYLLKQGITSLVYYNSYEEIVQAAANNNENIFVSDEPPALYFLYKNGIQDEFNYSEPLYSGEFHRAVKKGNTQILGLVNQGFSSISDQEYRAIDNRWFGISRANDITLIMPYLGVGITLTLLIIVSLSIFNRTLQTRVNRRTKELEEALAHLRESEALFRDLIEFLPIPISIANDQGEILDVNHKFTEHYGYRVEDIPTISDWIMNAYPDPTYREKSKIQWDTDVNNAMENGTSTPLSEYQVTGKDGSLHDVEITMRPVKGIWVASFVEITERKKTESVLRESSERYRALVENQTEFIVRWKPDRTRTFVNEAYCRYFGLTYEQAMAVDFMSLIFEEDRQALREKISRLKAGLVDSETDTHRVIKPDGSFGWQEWVDTAVRDKNGKLVEFQSVGRDISQRKQVEETLRKLSHAVEQSNASIVITNLDGTIEYVNSYFSELTGYTSQEVIGLNPRFLKSGLVSNDVYKDLWNTITSGSEWQGEFCNKKKNGELYWEFASISPIVDNHGTITHFVAVKTNITERKQAEKIILKQLAFEELMTGILTRFATCSHDEIDSSIREALQKIAAFMNIERAYMIIIDPKNRESWSVTHEWHGTHIQPRIPEHQKIPFGTFPWAENEILAGNITRINTLDEYPPEASAVLSLHRSDGTKSVLNVPVRGTDGLISGCIGGHTYSSPTNWSDDDVTHLKMVGDTIANLLERKRAEENLERQLEHLRTLRKVDQAITIGMELKEILDMFVEEVATQLQVDAVSVLLLDQDQRLNFAAGYGFSQADTLKYTRLQIGQGLAGQVAKELQILHIQNLLTMKGNPTLILAIAKEKFITYVGVPLVAKDHLYGVLEIFHRSEFSPKDEWFDFLETMAGQAAISIDSSTLFEDLQQSNRELQIAYDTTLEGWSHALDLRDKETEGHTQRVTEITLELARNLGISENELVNIRRGALLHDIGKMGVPDTILLKPGSLTAEEWTIMRKHPEYAYEMLLPIQYLHPALAIPHYHHERWDGTGYPRGLKGEDIPLAARIFAVVDAWDAVQSERPYKNAWSKEEAIAFIKKVSGTHFDPTVVNIFLKLVDQGKI